MKLHTTLVDSLLKIMEINSGWKDEWKLKAALNGMDISVYTQQNGVQILVPTKELQKHVTTANQREDQEKQNRLDKLVQDAKRANGET